MALTPHAYMEWLAPPRTRLGPALGGVLRVIPTRHGHLVPCLDAASMGLTIEDCVEVFADTLRACSQDKHGERGYAHSESEIKEACLHVMNELLTRDFEAEWQELHREIAIYQKWGGKRPVPAAVLMPLWEDPKRWVAIMPDRQGEPKVYDLRPKVLEDIMPLDGKVVPDRARIGWRVPRRREK